MKRIHNFSYFSLLLEKNQVDPIPENLYAEETVAPLPFSDEIKDNKEEFLKKINYIAKELGIKPEWLMIAIHNESGFDPHVSNPSSGATGLIQFMPSTIVDYIHPERKTSMTTADLKDMDSIEQLDVVYEYLKQAKKAVGFKDSEKIEKPGDFFSLIFYPVLVKSRDEFQFPDNVIKSNRDLFSRIGGTTKKDYYNYCERIVENPQDMASKVKNFDLFGFFGEGSGANSDLFKEMIEILARFSSQTGGSVLSALDSAASKSE